MNEKLKYLENESIKLIKIIFNNFDYNNIGILWSCGKDSTVLLHLIQKAFNGKIPCKVIHIDTGLKIKKMIEYRDNFFTNNNVDNIVCKNLNFEIINKKYNKIDCCNQLKTQPLNDVIYNENNFYKYYVRNNKYYQYYQKHQIKALFVGIRHDEEKTRSKEKLISKRYKYDWDYGNLSLNIGNFYSFDCNDESHYRIHPLLYWTEKDIWEYIKEENIQYIDLYLSDNGYRYRSIGCECCTNKICSNAKTTKDIINELKSNLKYVPERSTRKQDNEFGLEDLRTKGYM